MSTEDKNKFLKNAKPNTLYIFLVLVLAIFATIVVTAQSKNKTLVNSETNAIFEQSWQYSIDGNSEYKTISFPNTIRDKITTNVTIKNTIPNKLVSGATIMFRTSQQNIQVYIDGELLYDSRLGGAGTNGQSSAYHFVRVPSDAMGKEILVIYDSSIARYRGLINEIFIGSKASHIFSIISSQLYGLATGCFVFIVGLIMLFGFIFFSRNRRNVIEIIFLGAFFICAGTWVIVESRIVQFFIPHPILLTNLSIFALSLMPVFLGLYFYKFCLVHYKRMMAYITSIIATASLILGIITCFSTTLPLILLPIFIVLIFITALAIFVTIILEYLKEKKLISISMWSLALFCVFSFIEMIIYLSDIKGTFTSYFWVIGLFLFASVMIFDLISQFTKSLQSSIEGDTLKKLAFTDGLTGLGNKMAFLEDIETTTIEENKKLSMFMFDLNDLKITNDTFGHLSGDMMLKQCALIINTLAAKEGKTYRIGGDEFVLILQHDQSFEISNLETQLNKLLVQENKKASAYQLSIAFGSATYAAETDTDFLATLARADKNMYACKKIQKDALAIKQ